MVDYRLNYFDVDYDLIKGSVKGELWAKQGDTGKGLCVTMWKRGKIYTPEPYERIRLNVLKPDGKRLWFGCEVEDSKLYFTLTNQTFTAEGDVLCEFEFISQGLSKKSDTFEIKVDKSMSYGAVESMEIDVDTIRIGTKISPPENLAKGEVWADVGDDTDNPVLRIKL